MPRIVILGIHAADLTFRMERLPALGETVLGSAFAKGPGGKGSNQAVACARAGGEAHILTRLGRDAFAEDALRLWREAGATAHAVRGDTPTGAAAILLTASGENAICVYPGAAGDLSPADVEAHAPLLKGAAILLTQLEQPLPAARRALEIARGAGVTTILNPAPAAPLDDALLRLCDWITPNETEAAALTGLPVTDRATAARAAAALRARGAGGALITLGADGAMLDAGKGPVHVPAFRAGPVAETTGAGDAFNGAGRTFAAALAEGRAPEAAARFACAAAAISVTRPGAAASAPLRAEIDALLARP